MTTLMRLMVAAFGIAIVGMPTVANAGKDNVFSASVSIGEAYFPTNYRLSFGSFDLGMAPGIGLYGGTRVWKGSTFAGFGLGMPYPHLGWYGTVGYEWRFIRVAGLTFEFLGTCAGSGETRAMGLAGVTVGW